MVLFDSRWASIRASVEPTRSAVFVKAGAGGCLGGVGFFFKTSVKSFSKPRSMKRALCGAASAAKARARAMRARLPLPRVMRNFSSIPSISSAIVRAKSATSRIACLSASLAASASSYCCRAAPPLAICNSRASPVSTIFVCNNADCAVTKALAAKSAKFICKKTSDLMFLSFSRVILLAILFFSKKIPKVLRNCVQTQKRVRI